MAVDDGNVAGIYPGGLFVATPQGVTYLQDGSGGPRRVWLYGNLLATVTAGNARVLDWTGAGTNIEVPGYAPTCSLVFADGVFAYCDRTPDHTGGQQRVTLWDVRSHVLRGIDLPDTRAGSDGCDLLDMRGHRLLYRSATGGLSVLDIHSGTATAVRGTDGGAYAARFAGADDLLLVGPTGDDARDLLIGIGHPTSADPLAQAPAVGTAIAGNGYFVQWSAARSSTVAYPAGEAPYDVGPYQPVALTGDPGFALRLACTDRYVIPTADDEGLPEAVPERPLLDDIAGQPYAAAIAAEVQACLWHGFPDGSFEPRAPFTRGQLATVLVRYWGLAQPHDVLLRDVPADRWDHDAAAAVVAAGLMGSGSTFGSDLAPVTLRDLALIVAAHEGWGAPGALAGLRAHGVTLPRPATPVADGVLSRAEAAELFHLLRQAVRTP